MMAKATLRAVNLDTRSSFVDAKTCYVRFGGDRTGTVTLNWKIEFSVWKPSLIIFFNMFLNF